MEEAEAALDLLRYQQVNPASALSEGVCVWCGGGGGGSLLETVKDRLHHSNDSGGTSASGAQSHPVPPKGRNRFAAISLLDYK